MCSNHTLKLTSYDTFSSCSHDFRIWRHASRNKIMYLFKTVLALAGIELLFFIACGVGLHFGFLLKTVLLIQGCSGYC